MLVRSLVYSSDASLVESDEALVAGIICSLPLWQRYGVTWERALATILDSKDLVARGDAEWLLAEVDGEVAGFIYILHKGCFGMSGYIKMIGVGQKFQGRRVGSRLIEAAEKSVFSRGNNIFLLVSDFNSGAIRFYESHGYQFVGSIREYVLPGVDELMYRKSLGPIAR